MSWEFFVKHFEDQEQAQRDSKFTWRMTNGSFYVGTSPPAGAEPLGIFYPRTGTLGGCGNHNAMNLALPPDSDVCEFLEHFISSFEGFASFGSLFE
jgi:choline dehydrogenase